jgi:hypothetical protein
VNDSDMTDDPAAGRDGDILWRFSRGHWRCTAHGRRICLRCQLKAQPPSVGSQEGDTWSANQTLSATGVRTVGGLACPRCGGTNFTAKRSADGVLLGGVFAPKSQVKCVTCGKIFKRG